MRCAGQLRGLDREQRCEGGVAVVGAPAAVETIALLHRKPRPEVVTPAGHLRLLVAVAVEQHGVVGWARRLGGGERRHLGHDQRAAPGQFVHLHRQPGNGARCAPGPDQFGGCVLVAVHLPVRVEGLRHAGDADVVVQRGQHVVGPDPADVIGDEAVAVAHRRVEAICSITRSASATMLRTMSPAGTSVSIAPTP